MFPRYEYARASGKQNLLLIFPEGAFENLPFEIRLHAPWTGCDYGLISELKPGQRAELRRFGYVIVRDAADKTAPQAVLAERGAMQKAA